VEIALLEAPEVEQAAADVDVDEFGQLGLAAPVQLRCRSGRQLGSCRVVLVDEGAGVADDDVVGFAVPLCESFVRVWVAVDGVTASGPGEAEGDCSLVVGRG
jgi:hypothetical protein